MVTRSKSEKRLVIVTSNKGGAGKTTFTRGYADYLRRDKTATAFLSDADGQVGQLLQFYGSRIAGSDDDIDPEQNGTVGVHYFNIKETRERDAIFDGLESGATRIVIDMPGGSFDLIRDIDRETDFFETVQRSGYAVTIVDVITPMLASVKTVTSMIETFGDIEGVAFVVVKNEFFGPTNDDWHIYNGSNAKTTLMARGGLEVLMPAMRMATFAAIDQHSLTFTAAVTSPRLGTANKSVVSGWLRKCEGEIEKAVGIL